ncbi:MAG: cytochrome c-type biogenesis protein CcmH [Gemmatimonadota bacterium]|nr:MAG: cytochrome c-type biogenesis protein CcmH [Gemmatimonadota bacterium]
MRVLLAALLILFVSAPALTAGGAVLAQETAGTVTVQAEDPELEAQVRELAAKLRCPTCRALSVQDSPSGMAQEMRSLIRDQLRAGKTPDEVTAYFVERYGEWILLEPKAEGFNWAVWLLPVFLLLGGLAFVLVTARRWVEQGQARAAAIVADAPEEEL